MTMMTLTIEQLRTTLKRADALGATRAKFEIQSPGPGRRGPKSPVEPPVATVIAHAHVPGRGWVGV